MKKGTAIFFLILSLPATCAGLFPIYVLYDSMQEPFEPETGTGIRPLMRFFIYALVIFVALGWTNVPGYVRQIWKPDSVAPLFWKRSMLYNTVLFFFTVGLAAFLAWGSGPFSMDGLIFFGAVVSIPLISLVLSLACLKRTKVAL